VPAKYSIEKATLLQPPRAVGHERRERDDQQHLADLGGLVLKERQVDPALGAAGRARDPEHEQVRGDEQAEDDELQLPQARVVDLREHDREEEPDAGVDPLALDVVVRAAGDVVLRRAVQDDQRAADQAEGGEQEPEVEPERRALGRHGEVVDGARRGCHDGAHSVFEFWAWTLGFTPSHLDAISRAAGAAAWAPKPPFSIVTATTSEREPAWM